MEVAFVKEGGPEGIGQRNHPQGEYSSSGRGAVRFLRECKGIVYLLATTTLGSGESIENVIRNRGRLGGPF